MASSGCLVYINANVAGGEGMMAMTTTEEKVKRKKEKGVLRQGLFLNFVSRLLCSALLRGFVVVGASVQKH